MESLAPEVAPFGIATTVVNPGFFRTELLTEQSTNYAEPSISDYDERRIKQLEFWKSQNGKQGGDPAKLSRSRRFRANTWIVPIPGTRRVDHLDENLGALDVHLAAEDVREMESAFAKIEVHGGRMSVKYMSEVETA